MEHQKIIDAIEKPLGKIIAVGLYKSKRVWKLQPSHPLFAYFFKISSTQ